MNDIKADIEADISAVMDRQESLALMEPLHIAEGSHHRGELTAPAEQDIAGGHSRSMRTFLKRIQTCPQNSALGSRARRSWTSRTFGVLSRKTARKKQEFGFIDRLEDQIATWSGFPKDVPSFLKPKFSVRDTDICFTVATEACFALGGKRFTFCG